MELALEGLNPNTQYNLDNIRYPPCEGDDPYGENCGGELYDLMKFYKGSGFVNHYLIPRWDGLDCIWNEETNPNPPPCAGIFEVKYGSYEKSHEMICKTGDFFPYLSPSC